MELYLQFGYGMKGITCELSRKWQETYVILSPRDISPLNLANWSGQFRQAGTQCLFDTQCYYPDATSPNLLQYTYWDSSLSEKLLHLSDKGWTKQFLQKVKVYNDKAETTGYILPSIMEPYEDNWEKRFFTRTKNLVEAANEVYQKNKPIFMTLALPAKLLQGREENIEQLMNKLLKLDVEGVYIIAEPPEGQYLVDDPAWVYNILKICAMSKLARKMVIYGYGNHQMLALALTKINALASGTWLNLRHFTNRFREAEDIKRKSKWVYYPEAFSEYKMAFLDWAYNQGHKDALTPRDKVFMDDSFRKIMKADIQPSQTGFNERDSFIHYLMALHHQVELLRGNSYEEVLAAYEMMLNAARIENERLEKIHVYPQTRGFSEIIDVNRAAIEKLNEGYGLPLTMEWKNL